MLKAISVEVWKNINNYVSNYFIFKTENLCKEHPHTGSRDFAFGNDVLLVPKSTFYITLQLYFSKQIVSAFIHTVYLVNFFCDLACNQACSMCFVKCLLNSYIR